ncbi:MAG TPA: hypothetical protein DDY78_26465 [Planctomycetales bacterium]|nr:hypothetical protein [Planctomycetales bacterium]
MGVGSGAIARGVPYGGEQAPGGRFPDVRPKDGRGQRPGFLRRKAGGGVEAERDSKGLKQEE